MKRTNTLTAADLAAVIRRLPSAPPVASELFEEDDDTRDWLLRLLMGLDELSSMTAQAFYEGELLMWQDVIWLAAQFGLPVRRVRSAHRDAASLDNEAQQVNAVREAIRWSEIEPRALAARELSKRETAGLTAIISPLQLLELIEGLPAAQPMTDMFTKAWKRMASKQKEKENVWYATQKEHWIGWLSGYDGPGAYDRKNHARSAEYVYNHIVNPQMLIYLEEAAGIESGLIREAIDVALEPSATTMASMSSRIRRVLTWSRIETELLRKH